MVSYNHSFIDLHGVMPGGYQYSISYLECLALHNKILPVKMFFL